MNASNASNAWSFSERKNKINKKFSSWIISIELVASDIRPFWIVLGSSGAILVCLVYTICIKSKFSVHTRWIVMLIESGRIEIPKRKFFFRMFHQLPRAEALLESYFSVNIRGDGIFDMVYSKKFSKHHEQRNQCEFGEHYSLYEEKRRRNYWILMNLDEWYCLMFQ